jgi:hypothetical protein
MKKTGRLNFEGLKCFLFALVLLATSLVSAETKMEIYTNPEDGIVAQGERFEAYLTIRSDEDIRADIQDRDFPEQIRLLEASNLGQSFSTRASAGPNGLVYEKTVINQYRFLFEALKTGKFEFPPIQVKVNDQLLSTLPFKMEVRSAGTAPRPQARGRQKPPNNPFGIDDEDDPFNQFLKEKNKMLEEMRRQLGRGNGGGFNAFDQADPQQIPKRQLDINPRDSFFVLLDVDKTEAFEGEQVTANWYLYTKTNILSLDRVKFPDLKGFWKEIIQEIPQLNFSPEIVNGEMYQKALIASHALFPIKPGQAVIDEFKIKSKASSRGSFNGGVIEATRSSKRQVIKVLPLPEEKRPPTFSGAVGQFQVQTHLEGVSFPAQQPFTVKIRFEGQGNAKTIELPPIQWPPSFEVFDTKSDAKFAVNGTSYKEFEVLVIPRLEGKFQLPAIQFSYFDPESKSYQTKSTEPIDLEITKSLGGGGTNSSKTSAAANGKKEGLENLFQPILEWPENSLLQILGASTWPEARWSVFAGVGGMSILGVMLFFFIELGKVARRPSFKVQIQLRFVELKKSLANKNERRAVTQSINVIYMLLASMAQEKSANQEWNGLIDKVPMNLRSKFEKRLSDLFEYFQIIGFAPESARQMTLNVKNLRDAVTELEVVSLEIINDLPKEQI